MRENVEGRLKFGAGAGFAVDTTFVLFLLALEFGRTLQMFSIDGGLMAITMLMVLVLPYFVASAAEKPAFGNWLIGRSFIAAFGLALGLAFKQSIGVVLPESLRFIPLTMLILASMISCYIQFYGLMKLRLAK